MATGQYWTSKAPFPVTAEVGYSFTIDNRMFVGGGLSAVSPATEYTGLNEYIPATDSWEPRAPLPAARYGVGGFSINGKGYVACGWHIGSPQLTDLWEYDPIADSWTQKASFPGGGRYSCISVATGSKGYLGLGYTPYANDWWEYDPLIDTWTQKAPFPMTGRQAASAFVIDGEVYVGLGARDVTALSATLYDDWYRYDPVADTWTAIATFPAAPRIGSYAFSFAGIGYVFCGLAAPRPTSARAVRTSPARTGCRSSSRMRSGSINRVASWE
jgi:N-acetylneuraminic acid mutarotase